MKTLIVTLVMAGAFVLPATGCAPKSLVDSMPIVEPQPLSVDDALLDRTP